MIKVKQSIRVNRDRQVDTGARLFRGVRTETWTDYHDKIERHRYIVIVRVPEELIFDVLESSGKLGLKRLYSGARELAAQMANSTVAEKIEFGGFLNHYIEFQEEEPEFIRQLLDLPRVAAQRLDSSSDGVSAFHRAADQVAEGTE